MRLPLFLAVASLFAAPAAHALCGPGTGNPQSQAFVVSVADATTGRRNQAERVQFIRERLAGLPVRLEMMRTLATGHDVIRLHGSDAAARRAVDRLLGSRGIVSIELDGEMTPQWVPVDTYYPQQWALKSGTGISAEPAWDISRGTGQLVAVLDTGYTPHTDMAPLIAGYDFVSNADNARDGDGRDAFPVDNGDWLAAGDCSKGRDSGWHGTHVAGIAGAIANNSKGVAGVAPGAGIQHVRVSGNGKALVSDVADAIMWASGASVPGVTDSTPRRATVLNISMALSGSCPSYLQAAIDYARANGVAVVAAAGNGGVDASTTSPASCNHVIAVGGHNSLGRRVTSSNFGPLVDLYAPGELIYSTYNSGKTTAGSETYAQATGTSQAAPLVAGTIALMQAVLPRSPETTLDILSRTAAAVVDCAGCRRLNAGAALAAASQWPDARFSIKMNCATGKMTLSNTSTDPNTGTAGLRYFWQFGGVATSTQAVPDNVPMHGVYTATLTVTDPVNTMFHTTAVQVVDAMCRTTQ